MTPPTPMVSPSDEIRGHLQWIVEQGESGMDTVSHVITDDKESAAALQMLHSTLSDIAINAQMASDKLSAQSSEPVGWMWEFRYGVTGEWRWRIELGSERLPDAKHRRNIRPVYTSPQHSSEVSGALTDIAKALQSYSGSQDKAELADLVLFHADALKGQSS